MGATTEEQGEWAIVGGTGQFAMARGVIQRKMHQKLADGQGDVLELTIEAFCRRKVNFLFNFCTDLLATSTLSL